MAFQNVSEKRHNGDGQAKEKHVLSRRVDGAMDDLEIKLAIVWNQWRMLLDLIIDDNFDDMLVDSKRGDMFPAPQKKAEMIE